MHLDEELGETAHKPPAGLAERPSGLINRLTVRDAWLDIEKRLHDAQATQALVSQPELYKVWVRWLHRLTRSRDAGDVFCSESYWTLLQQGLRPASAEQRRYCLYIMGKSIALLDQAVNVPCFAFSAGDSVFIEAYEKYCTLFSTFVLDRYINQVEECLPELRDLAASAGQVDPSWIIVLLGATLQHGIQDSVRKAVGDHFMQWSIMGFQETAVWSEFLIQAFLPWACQGYLFTGSITRVGVTIRCEHGERLAAFLNRLVYLCSDADDILFLSRLLLQYIVDTPKLFPYAGAYILHGLLSSTTELANELGLTYGSEDKDLAMRVIARADLPEMAREAWKTTLRDLCQLNQHNANDCPKVLTSQPSLFITELNNFHTIQSTSFSRNPDAAGTTVCSSMQELLAFDAPARLSNFIELVRRTNYQCLQRDGLIRGLAYVERCHEDPNSLYDADIFYNVLLALWTEVEIQDFPKSALIRLPGIAFTEKAFSRVDVRAPEICVDERPNLSSESCSGYPEKTDLHCLILEIWSGLANLSRGRIYLLAPLTRALHELCFTEYGEGCTLGPEITTPDGCEHMHYLYPPSRIIPLNNFIAELASNPPRSKVEFQLEAAVAPMLDRTASALEIYERHYGQSEGMGYAYVFDLLNRCSFNDISMRHLLDRLLKPWLDQQLPVLIVSKWKHTVQLQFMLILIHQIEGPKLLSDYFAKFLNVLAIEPMPRYRFLLQWIVSTIYNKAASENHWDSPHKQLIAEMHDMILEPMRKVDQENPKYVGAILKIGVAICKTKRRMLSDFPLQLMTAMVAICASPKIVIRHEAQWSFVALWDFAKTQLAIGALEQSEQWAGIINNPVLKALSEYMQKLDRYTNPPPERLLEEFDFNTENTLTNLFEGRYLEIDPPEAPLILREDFIRVWEHANLPITKADHLLDGELPHGPSQTNGRIPLGERRGTVATQGAIEITADSNAQATAKSKVPLQTKAATWQTVLDSISDTSVTPSINRHVRPIIVFASHIASAVNLGGLSRASEVFGAAALIVAKADIVRDKAFLGVSVNSHLHIPIEEVKPDEQTVLAWLRGRKDEGYGVVGVEQTDRSTVLGERRGGGEDVRAFPRKCVLVMGSEREGIPGWLLAECDAGCVEIPQVGVTRSLNVQTAAAVALYEYGRQQG